MSGVRSHLFALQVGPWEGFRLVSGDAVVCTRLWPHCYSQLSYLQSCQENQRKPRIFVHERVKGRFAQNVCCRCAVLYCIFFFFLHKRGCKTDNTREDRTFKIIQKVCKNIWRRFWQQVFGLCVCSCTKWRHFCYSSQLESSVKGLWLGFIVKVRTGYSMSLWAPTTFTGERK